ncbi:MAG: S1C family serine protease, partial [Acidobacteriaceae bacterium]
KPTEPPQPTETSLPSNQVSNLADLKKATIQIEAQGTFIDPEFGFIPNAAGRGSGFIIDPSGIAVTNNHVVTGAALLKVWVGGDTSKVYNARILGVSECSDLAVIDIEGDGFPYLSWFDNTTSVGLEVYLAGYPLGDPEYTMTKGIVSKEKADGETSWSSVDSVIEHTATSNPGNSGGPLVDANAKVVGVHYASNSTTQYFAIDHGIALSVINQLRTGKDVDSIGINGQAVMSEDGSLTGIWVSSVESGSPADKSGVKAADIILSMEGLTLARDGTMKDYCDILRSHNPDATLALEVLRWESQEVLEGQLNGRNLEVSYTFNQPEPTEAGSQEPSPTEEGVAMPTNCQESSTSGYLTCWDDSGNITVDVPNYWTDVNGTSWIFGEDDEEIGVAISAAPSLSDFSDYYNAEGIFFGASDTFAKWGGYVEFLDYYTGAYSEDCTLVGRYNYEDAYYRGKYDRYINCGGSGGYEAFVLSAVDIVDPTSKIILIEAQIYPDDVDTINQIFDTFYVYF